MHTRILWLHTLLQFIRGRNYSNVIFVLLISHERAARIDTFHPFMTVWCFLDVTCCSYKSNLTVHIAAVHENKKSSKCDICDYSCSRKNCFNVHIAAIHEGKKPFKCDICDYNCSRKNVMIQHIASVHVRETQFICDICDYLQLLSKE